MNLKILLRNSSEGRGKQKLKILRKLRNMEDRNSNANIKIIVFSEGRKDIGREKNIQRNDDGK